MIFFFRNKKYKKNIKIREDISLLGRSKKCEEFSHYLFIFVFLSFLSPVWCWFSRASRPEKFQTLWIWKNRSPRQHSNVDERDRTKKKRNQRQTFFCLFFYFFCCLPRQFQSSHFYTRRHHCHQKQGGLLLFSVHYLLPFRNHFRLCYNSWNESNQQRL